MSTFPNILSDTDDSIAGQPNPVGVAMDDFSASSSPGGAVPRGQLSSPPIVRGLPTFYSPRLPYLGSIFRPIQQTSNFEHCNG
jgi:hypothetical protein